MDVKNAFVPFAHGAATGDGLGRIGQHIVETGLAPAVSIAVYRRRTEGWEPSTAAAGWVSQTPSGAATPDTPFDLASLTKPFVALTCAELARQSRLRLTGKLGHYLPELSSAPVSQASIEQALAHRTHLAPHRVLYGPCIDARAISKPVMLLRAAESLDRSARRDESDPTAIYSDLGYLIAGAVLERVSGVPLDRLVDECLLQRLRAPIASSRQWQARTVDFVNKVAPTEYVPWRGATLRGVVHDENAWAWAGRGIAGHAGLFATAAGVAQLGLSVVDALAGRVSPISRFAAQFCTALRPGGSLRAGFDGVSEGRSSAGSRMSRLAFGHLGFTGTSLWCDPENEIVIAVLTNRVCPTRDNARLPSLRAEIHDQLFQWAQMRQGAS